jgi:hypothetical protein
MLDFIQEHVIKDSGGLTPQMYAGKNNYPISMKFLTENLSVNLNEEDNEGYTILMHTVF